MDLALTDARVIRPIFVGIGMLANGAVYHERAVEFLGAYPFVYFSGILAAVAGVAMLNAYHARTLDWASSDHRARLLHHGRRDVPHSGAAVSLSLAVQS